jgi:predicted DNA-binding transcriptional regulator YafY
MARSGDSFLRRWHVLAALPRAPVAIDLETIAAALASIGIEATSATVAKDLAALAESFPLRRDPRSERPLWSWTSDAPSWEFPALDAAAATVLVALAQQARAVFPRGALGLLAPLTARAHDVLGDAANRVRVLPWGPLVGPPEVDPSVLIPVLLAIREQRALDLRYLRTEREAVRLEVDPFGLVVREGRLYLVAGLASAENPTVLVLHKIARATLLDRSATVPRDLDFDVYLQEGAPGLSDPESIDLELRFEPEIGPALVDARLDGAYELLEESDGTWLLRASVADTSQLRAWVLSYGTFVEVLGPPPLREWVAEQAVAMSERYL